MQRSTPRPYLNFGQEPPNEMVEGLTQAKRTEHASLVRPTLYASGTGQLKKGLVSGLRRPIISGKISWYNMD